MYTTFQEAKMGMSRIQRSNVDGQDGGRSARWTEQKFKMKVTGADGAEEGKGLDEIQEQIGVAAKAINFSTRAMRQNAENKIPYGVTTREKAAARSDRSIEKTCSQKTRQGKLEQDMR